MRKKTTVFLLISIVVLIVITVGGLYYANYVTEEKSSETITEVGNVYMTGLNERISLHFTSTIESRMNRLEYIVDSVPPGKYDDYNQMKSEMSYAAEARGLDYLAYLSSNGEFETLYGDSVTIDDPDTFLEQMDSGETFIAAGKDSNGEYIAIMGVSSAYDMLSGEKSTALVAGIKMRYLKQLLALDSEDTIVYSNIITHDGTYVMKSRDTDTGDNYLDIIHGHNIEGHTHSTDECEQTFIDAMNNEEDFSAVFMLDDNTREHIYCTSLPYSDWYLITVMPYGELDRTISSASKTRNIMMFVYLGVVVAVMIIIFVIYLSMSRKQLRELEKARAEALAASKAKSDFLSNMSHDIRTPMNAIVGMTAIAAANIDNQKKTEDCLRKITLSSRHLLGLINDILDMSTIENGKMSLNTELVSLKEVMEGLVTIVQPQIKAKNLNFDIFIYDVTEEHVYCDSVRLNQILINFLSNAIKFTPDGGTVNVTLREEQSPKGENHVRVHLYVKDTGIGISEEFQKIIFESFAREDNKRVHKTEGTGLGMAIAKHIIDAMEGTVEIESELGKGTQFHVTLDMEIAEIQEEDMILPEWHMLLVDDDENLCESTIHALNSIGLLAEFTHDGETAVDMVYERHMKHNDYQIVLLDWQLPGIDGIETARRIRKQVGSDVPILLISAYDWSDFEEEAREAGVNGFIAKPLFKSTLFYGIKHYADNSEIMFGTQFNDGGVNFTGKRILIAEDNELNWEIANELLAQLGLEIDHAENGKICVDMMEKSPVGYYSAVLMDIRMPVLNGYDATLAIRGLDRKDSDIPIIAMTADAFSDDIRRCLDYGMNAHTAKPINIQEVTRLLKKYI